MSNHRMFSNSITQSARFLRMPLSTQALYFHLGMQADDDGVVEAFTTMRLIGAMEDDLRVLAAKGFVKILNEDLVSWITDWNTNNIIRKERYKPSIYNSLLVQVGVLPEPEQKPTVTQLSPKRHPTGTQAAPNGRQTGALIQDNTRQDNLRQYNDKESPADPSQCISPDELVLYAQAHLTPLSMNNLEELLSYRDSFTDEMITKAIDETLGNGARAYAYCRSILNRWLQAGYKTPAEVDAESARRKAEKAAASAPAGKPAKQMIQRTITEDEFKDDDPYTEFMNRRRA